jgi:hypothetical protein
MGFRGQLLQFRRCDSCPRVARRTYPVTNVHHRRFVLQQHLDNFGMVEKGGIVQWFHLVLQHTPGV